VSAPRYGAGGLNVSTAGTPVQAGARLNNYASAATRSACSCGLALFVLLLGSRVLQTAIAEGDTRTISLHHIHTDEDITITYKRDGRYDEAALEKLNRFLRDWRREQQTRMDPHLIDLVWEVHRETGSKEPIWVVCGYRSPETNSMLRRRSKGVARFSQHMLGHAMDFYIPGVRLEELRVFGLRLQRGGVGFYPSSGSPFVHMDTGDIRHWPRMTREQLVRVFPDGRTVHIPSDGKPLSGYALALAEVVSHGGTPSDKSIDAARSAGVNVDVTGLEPHKPNRFLKLLGLAKDEEEGDTSAPAQSASAETTPAAPPLRTRAKAAVAAAIMRAKDGLAAEKAKLAQTAAKLRVIAHAEATPAKPQEAASRVATSGPNDIIAARGFWQGAPDDVDGEQPASANPLTDVGHQRSIETMVADADMTSGVGVAAHDDRGAAKAMLAYAEQPGRDAAARSAALTAPLGAATPPPAAITHAVTAPPNENDTTIAVKRVSGRPLSVLSTVANKIASVTDARFNNPWLRAIVWSPSVRRFLSTTALGARDFRALAAQMAKPATSVIMTFCADPHAGLAHDRFSGNAVVFVPTVTYPIRTADLR
jgi:uncharacterized protein YcbK (DUF882 family)